MRMSPSGAAGISLQDLSRLGVPPERLLGEDQLAVHRDLEHAARRRDQPDVGVGEGLLQLSRQTGGSGLVVSDDAVLDDHAHRRRPSRYGAGPPRIVVRPRSDAKGDAAGCDGAPCQSRLGDRIYLIHANLPTPRQGLGPGASAPGRPRPLGGLCPSRACAPSSAAVPGRARRGRRLPVVRQRHRPGRRRPAGWAGSGVWLPLNFSVEVEGGFASPKTKAG